MFGDEEGDKEGHPLAITIVNVAYPSGQPASQPALSLAAFPIKPDSALEAYRASPVPKFRQESSRKGIKLHRGWKEERSPITNSDRPPAIQLPRTGRALTTTDPGPPRPRVTNERERERERTGRAGSVQVDKGARIKPPLHTHVLGTGRERERESVRATASSRGQRERRRGENKVVAGTCWTLSLGFGVRP